MPRLGPIDIPVALLDAIRDDKLVIFAGAGVSVGHPANLPNFVDLAVDIAKGTGLLRNENESVDHFLGRLQHAGEDVHLKVGKRLSVSSSAPTALHQDLVRIFRNPESIRLVTTNFDVHFETAAETLYGRSPDIYYAPALPLGRNFRGLVHVHGALTRPSEMVVTDVDFGRAYLTEGWARRFLLDVFRCYTVLFVGYSHTDIVMKYLARALPIDGFANRYALTEEHETWKFLGISPILFQKIDGENVYQELYEGVRCLAERAGRGVLDWQTRLTEIGSQVPPKDIQTINEIEEALREAYTTRFFTKVARQREWPRWLEAQSHLSSLFDNAPLGERDRLLVSWLAEHYVIDHADEVISLIIAKSLRINPECWWEFGRRLALTDKKQLDASKFSRWVSILLACAPDNADLHILEWLATRCSKEGNIALATEVFLLMGSCRLTIKLRYPDEGEQEASRFDVSTPLKGEHFGLNKVWQDQLKPHLATIAPSFLSGVVGKMEDIHRKRAPWKKDEHDWGDPTWGRSAIEAHEQDQYPEPIDVLIDAARDTLEWLAGHEPMLFDSWVERLIVSGVPLLRRLAIHALTVHPNKSPDEILTWLLMRAGLHSRAERHEIYRATSLSYPNASESLRRMVIDTVVGHRIMDAEGQVIAEQTAREHFNWLDWLQQSDSTCSLIQTALTPIKAAYPHWIPREYPDLEHWVRFGRQGTESPWTVEQVLAMVPDERLNDLLHFEGNHFDGPNRDGLRLVIQEACKQRPLWAFQLDKALSRQGQWDSDFWPFVLKGFQEAELTANEWKVMRKSIARHELQSRYAREIADLIFSLVHGIHTVQPILVKAIQPIAKELWKALSRTDEVTVETDWLSKAINHPAGILVQFWIKALSHTNSSKSNRQKRLPAGYRKLFTSVVQDDSAVGAMGRCVLASQVEFLFRVDESWTRKYMIPLFISPDLEIFKQAWDGFIVWGRLHDLLAEALKPAFISAVPRLNTDISQKHRRFINLFAALVVFDLNDPTSDLVPALLHYGSTEDRNSFAYHLGVFLANMSPAMRQSLWERWVYRYWKSRLTSTSAPLAESEMKTMQDWLPHLGEQFPEGVSLAVQMPITYLEHCDSIRKLRESDLVVRFPPDTAKLLIYLSPILPKYQQADILAIVARLPPLEINLKRELDESLARAGFK